MSHSTALTAERATATAPHRSGAPVRPSASSTSPPTSSSCRSSSCSSRCSSSRSSTRGTSACSRASSSAARCSRASRNYVPGTHRSASSSRASAGSRLFFVVQVPIMLGLALFVALALDSCAPAGRRPSGCSIFMPYAVPAVVATLMWGYLYGPDFGPLAQIARALGFGTPDFLSRREHPRLDDEHRHVGVRRLQHDHHVRGPAVDPGRAVRGGRDRRRRASSGSPGASRSPRSAPRSC